MTGLFIKHPDMSYKEFEEMLDDLAAKGIRATFKRPLIVGDKAGPENLSVGYPVQIIFLGATDLILTNLRISWDAREDNVILERWKV